MGNTPNIRFKGFTDDWEQRKLDDVVEDYVERTMVENQYPVLTSSQRKGIVLQDEYFSGDKVSQSGNIGYFIIPRGYFAFRSRSDNDVFVFNRNDVVDMGIISYFYPVFKPRGVDSDFLLYRLNYGLENQIKINSEGTGQHVLSLKKFKNMIGLFPSYEEQKRIGTYFSQIDHLITLHQRKCDETKKLKKFMLQKMFPKKDANKPEIRFAGFTDDWEQRKWIDTVDISTEMVDPTTGEYDDMPHIAPGNIEPFTGRILDNVKTVKEEQLISGKFRFRPNDVVYGKINPQLGKYFYASIDGLTSADAYVFNGKNGITQKFLYSVLQTKDFFKYSISVSKRSGMPKINRDELNAYSFCVPKEEEQEKIGDFLLGIDNLITLHQRKCDELKEFKKYMLQNMFPQKG